MVNSSLSIIIVNWNTRDQLRECVSSICDVKQNNFVISEVVIVDNASWDNSLASLDGFGVNLKVIRNNENRGFAAACNQGAAAASGQYLLFLNPDTRLFENSLSVPIDFMDRTENAYVGICGIQLVDESGKKCLSYAQFPSLINFFLQAIGANKLLSKNGRGRDGVVMCFESGDLLVDQIIGAFFIVRRHVYAQLKGFDERFFVYFEEVDFALRAYNNGWSSVCLTKAQCIHIGGGSSRQVKTERLFYSLRSRLLYGAKHFPLLSALILFVLTLTIELVSRLAIFFIKGSLVDCAHVIKSYLLLLKTLPETLRVAILIKKR